MVFRIVLVLLGASIIATAQDKPAKKEAPSQAEIDKAIDSGAEFLKKAQGADGKWDMGPGDLGSHAFKDNMGAQALGHTALNLLALLVADVDPDDASIARAFKYLTDHRAEFGHTYNCALTLMAFEAWAEKKMRKDCRKDKASCFHKLPQVEQDFAEQLALRLARSQLDDGSWTYACVPGEAGGGGSGTQVRKEAPSKGGGPGPLPPQFAELGGDYSNTQYALLGLRAATELGIRFTQAVWLRAMEGFLNRQEKTGPKVKPFPVPAATDELWMGSSKPSKEIPKGATQQTTGGGGDRAEFEARGWGYSIKMSRPESYGAMTCIGVASLVMCKYYSRGNANFKGAIVDRCNRGIEDGCAWLATNFDVKDNAKWSDARVPYKNTAPKIDGYYMYGIERAGVLASLVKFGEHDWYALGARVLVDRQQTDGSWSSEMFYEPKATISTSFAILFLKRATQPIIVTGGSAPAPKKEGTTSGDDRK